MNLTEEQVAIINSSGNIKINAVAGSGKTITVIEYAKARPSSAKILYLAFNKSVKLEAEKKFADKGLNNVKVETAHSLAYRYVVYQQQYKIRAQGYKVNEIVDLLGLQATGDKHAVYIVANHINKFIAYFCNSDKHKVQELNYLDVVTDAAAITFVTNFYKYIEAQTRLLLSKMNKGDIEITHDFYLKKFQLMNPQLNYDYILFDEAQDASPAMLDIFLKQKAIKVIVGDTHQQIYGWRYAVNSLEKADFSTFHLSTSFRFSQDIANLAVEVLKWKSMIGKHESLPITGKGKTSDILTKAVIGRTNLGLLLKAIEYINEKKKVQHIYFEGNINSYTYADDGASLYDVLSLYNGKKHLIKDSLIKAIKDMDELEDYIEKTEDVQLGMMVEIVKEYGNEIPDIIKKLKDKHVPNEERHKAEIIFSTVHRCKGLEYDAIHLANDFINEAKLKRAKEESKKAPINVSKLNEEINLLYVAITRTKNMLHIPETILPAGFPVSKHINIIPVLSIEEKKENKDSGKKVSSFKEFDAKKGKTYSVELSREKLKDANQPWAAELDEELIDLFCEGKDLMDMAKHFKRTKGAIIARIKMLDLYERFG
jgi:F-box protein 18 (helicase)